MAIPRRTFSNLGLCIAVLLAVALAGVSFQRKISSFRSTRLELKPAPGFVEILATPTAEPERSSGLRASDRIVLVDGVPVASIADPAARLSQPPFPHRLAVVRGAAVLSITLARPALRIDFRYLLIAFVGIIYLLVGLVTAARDDGSPARLFAGFCVSVFGIALITPAGPVDGTWKLLWLGEDLFRSLAPALLVHFFAIFPDRLPAASRRAAIYYLPSAAYLAIEAALSLPSASALVARLPQVVELSERFWLLLLAIAASVALTRIVRTATGAPEGTLRRQARWIAVGCACGLVPLIVLNVLPRLFGFSEAWGGIPAIVCLAFVPVGFAYAILRWRLWDVDVFAREIAAMAVAVFLGIASFVLINALLNQLIDSTASESRNLAAFGSGLLLASLLVPVKRRLSDALERIQYGESYRARRALLDFLRRTRGNRDPNALAEALVEHMKNALGVSPCELYLRGAETGASFPDFDAADRVLAGRDAASLRPTLLGEASRGDETGFFRRGFRNLFALKAGGTLVGVLAAGLKDGVAPLSSEDAALVATVMSQASLAFENVALYRALKSQMTESAERARMASLGELAAGVAHEVNTPLAGISSYAQMLLSDTDPSDPRYAVLKKIERQTFRASHLVRDLLDFSRGRRLEPGDSDLARVVREAIESCETELKARNVAVLATGLNAPVAARIDARRFEQVVVNLIVNARDASPPGSTIDVELVAEGNLCELVVRDRGRGLDADEARRAFEPFFTTKRSGTGLGLALAREIVESHGGTISLSTRDGGGAVARVALPR